MTNTTNQDKNNLIELNPDQIVIQVEYPCALKIEPKNFRELRDKIIERRKGLLEKLADS